MALDFKKAHAAVNSEWLNQVEEEKKTKAANTAKQKANYKSVKKTTGKSKNIAKTLPYNNTKDTTSTTDNKTPQSIPYNTNKHDVSGVTRETNEKQQYRSDYLVKKDYERSNAETIKVNDQAIKAGRLQMNQMANGIDTYLKTGSVVDRNADPIKYANTTDDYNYVASGNKAENYVKGFANTTIGSYMNAAAATMLSGKNVNVARSLSKQDYIGAMREIIAPIIQKKTGVNISQYDSNSPSPLQVMEQYVVSKTDMKQKAENLITKGQTQVDYSLKDAGSVGKFVGEAGQSVGGMVVDAGLGLLTGSGLVSMYVRSAGAAEKEARDKGYGETDSYLYGMAQGVKEAATEMLFGGVTKAIYGEGAVDTAEILAKKFTSRLANETTKSMTEKALKLGLSINEEGMEEAIADILDLGINKFILGETDERTAAEFIGDTLYDYAQGAFASAVMGGAANVAGRVTNRNSTVAGTDNNAPTQPGNPIQQAEAQLNQLKTDAGINQTTSEDTTKEQIISEIETITEGLMPRAELENKSTDQLQSMLDDFRGVAKTETKQAKTDNASQWKEGDSYSYPGKNSPQDPAAYQYEVVSQGSDGKTRHTFFTDEKKAQANADNYNAMFGEGAAQVVNLQNEGELYNAVQQVTGNRAASQAESEAYLTQQTGKTADQLRAESENLFNQQQASINNNVQENYNENGGDIRQALQNTENKPKNIPYNNSKYDTREKRIAAGVTSDRVENYHEKMAKAYGLNYVYSVDPEENGHIKGNTIVFNPEKKHVVGPNAGKYKTLTGFTFSHEIGHFFEGTDEYNNYMDFVESNISEMGYNYEAELDKIKEIYKDTEGYKACKTDKERRDYLRSELTADFNEFLFADEKFANRLAVENPTLFEKIRNAINDFIKIAKATLAGDNETAFLIKARRNFEKAARVAQNIDRTNKNIVKYSIDSVAESIGLTVEKNENGFIEFYDSKGNKVDNVTPELIRKSPMGQLLTRAAGRGNISQEQAQKSIELYANLSQQLQSTQDPDLIWAINSVIGFNPMPVGKRPANSFNNTKNRFAAFTSNSDPQYKTTIDMTTICTRTQAIVDAMSGVMMEEGRGLTEDEIINIVYKNVFEAGEPVPCPVCYVFSRWVGLGGLFDRMKTFQEKYDIMDTSELKSVYNSLEKQIDQYVKDNSTDSKKVTGTDARNKVDRQIRDEYNKLKEAELMSAVTGIELTSEEKSRMKALSEKMDVLDAWSYLGRVRLNENYSKEGKVPDSVLFNMNDAVNFAEKYPLAWGYRTTRGPSMGKAAAPYTDLRLGQVIQGISGKDLSKIGNVNGSRNNGFINLTQKGELGKSAQDQITKATSRAKIQNLLNGQRLQSTSDTRPEYALDYLLAYTELMSVKSKAQLYTKVAELVRMHATLGTEVNLSTMPKGTGVKSDGTLDFSDVTGMKIEDAILLSNEYDNVQIITVGIGHEHIRLLMDDDRIQFVIPYHASGSSESRYKWMMDILDESVEGRTDFAEYESEHENENATQLMKDAYELRLKILTGKAANLTEDEIKILENKTYEPLRQLYLRFYGHNQYGETEKISDKYIRPSQRGGNEYTDDDTLNVFMPKAQAEVIMPYEYWDMTLNYDQADQNGQTYMGYVKSLGLTPVFSGVKRSGAYEAEGDFTSYPGYWKTLIDRRMYNRDGTYHEQMPVNIENFDLNLMNPEYGSTGLQGKMQENHREKTAEIVRKSRQELRERQSKQSIGEGAFQDRVTPEEDKRYMQLAINPEKNRKQLMDMVEMAAFKAGYFPVNRYHQTDKVFTKFSTDNPVAGANDSETPNGIFFKDNDHDIGVGGDYVNTGRGGEIQMPLWLKFKNTLHFKNRSEANAWYCDNVPGYKQTQEELKDSMKPFEARLAMIEDEQFNENTSDERMDELFSIEDEVIKELGEVENDYRKKLRGLLDDYFLNNDSGYDGIELDDDGHRYINGRREDVHTYIAFKPSQAKSSDVIARDDSGAIIPLSKRFDESQDDIRYSYREGISARNKQEAELLDRLWNKAGGKGKYSEGMNIPYNKYATISEEETVAKAAKNVPPQETRKAQEYTKRSGRNFRDNLLADLHITRWADSKAMKAYTDELQEKIKTGTLTEADKDRLFMDILAEGEVINQDKADIYGDLVTDLKNRTIYVPYEVSKNITDYKAFKRNSKLKLSNKTGVSIDDLYGSESDYGLQKKYGTEMFPNFNAQEEMLEHLDAVYKDATNIYTPLSQMSESQIDEAMTEYRAKFDKAVEQLEKDLNIAKRYNDFRANKSTEETFNDYNQLNYYKKAAERVKNKVLLTDEDRADLKMLHKGTLTEEQLRARNENADNVLKVYEAEKPVMQLQEQLKKQGDETHAKYREIAEGVLANSDNWKEKKAGIRFSTDTAERNMEDLAGMAEGFMINDNYFTPIHDNEAKSTRMKNDYRDEVRKLNISEKPVYNISNLTNIQSDELQAALQENGTDKDWKVSESALVQMYGEGLLDKTQLTELGADVEKIENAVATMRNYYEQMLDQANQVLILHGYEPIAHRQNYFPHFTETKPDSIIAEIGSALGFNVKKDELPTDIAGLTHTFKPGKKWFGNALERKGKRTEYDALEGFDRYVEGIGDVIFHTADIQKLRTFESELRYKYSEQGQKDRLDEVNNNPNLSEIEKEAKRQAVYEAGMTKHGTLAQWIRRYTDTLAGKKSMSDREMEYQAGRKSYGIVKSLENRVAANMVALNPGSWLTNFIPLVQGSEVKNSNIIKGMAGAVQNLFQDDGFKDRSTFLTNRAGTDTLVSSNVEKITDTLTKPMEWIDTFTSQSLVRAKYLQGIQEGKEEWEAMEEADRFAANVIADRSKGSLPLIFESKNPLTKILTMYQVEVNNQWNHLFKDIPRTEGNVAKTAAAYAKFAIGAYIFNDVFEKVVGRRPALDPLSWLNDLAGDLTGKQVPNFIDAISATLSPDDDEEDENVLDRLLALFEADTTTAGNAVANLAKNVAEDLPFIGGVLGGGRVPIQSALPDVGEIVTNAADLISEDANSKKAWSNIANELSNPLTYIVPPVGGGQAKKVYQSTKDILSGGNYAINSKGEQQLRYAVDNTYENWIKGLLFGQYALEGGQEYIEGGYKQLNALGTTAYDALRKTGVKNSEAEAIIRDVNSGNKADKIAKLQAADLTAEQKNTVAEILDITSYKKEPVEYSDGPSVYEAPAEAEETKEAENTTTSAAKKDNLSNKQQKYVDALTEAGLDTKTATDAAKSLKNYSVDYIKAATLMEKDYYTDDICEALGIDDKAIDRAKVIHDNGYDVFTVNKRWKAANADNKGAVTQEEAKNYLDKQNMSKKEKAAWWKILTGGSDKRNPYN